jgi:heme-degrading monooxygenase HmoA
MGEKARAYWLYYNELGGVGGLADRSSAAYRRGQEMFAVIFEVEPRPEAWDTYLDYAKLLRPELVQIEGFIENERFASLRRPGWLLSLSIWRDQAAVIRWRNHAGHHEIQQKGREEVFRDYRLRVGKIIADSHFPAAQSPQREHGGETRAAAQFIELSESSQDDRQPGPDLGAMAARLGINALESEAWDVFESIYHAGKFISLASRLDAGGRAVRPVSAMDGVRYRRVRVVRDYGMFARAEAPQYYPPVPRERAVD